MRQLTLFDEATEWKELVALQEAEMERLDMEPILCACENVECEYTLEFGGESPSLYLMNGGLMEFFDLGHEGARVLFEKLGDWLGYRTDVAR